VTILDQVPNHNQATKMNILHIDSSINGKKSISGHLSRAIVERLTALQPAAVVVRRDLALHPLPYFDAASPGVEPDKKLVLDEFMWADVIVVGAPMYNFGVPAQLKTWIDYLAVAGVTFRYTANGPEGLAGGRRVFIASSRGGMYGAGTPMAVMDHQESYLKAVFGFFGITGIEVVRAEGMGLGGDAAASAIASAEEAVRNIVL
jgi:FMN-dependent NADH-azoreductase